MIQLRAFGRITSTVVLATAFVPAIAFGDVLIVGRGQQLQRIENNGSGLVGIAALNGTFDRGVHFSASNNRIYITDGTFIRSTDVNGSNLVTVVASANTISDVVVDTTNQKLIWSEPQGGLIKRSNLNGTGIQTIVTESPNGPSQLAIDTAGQRIFWTTGTRGEIKRAALNGSNVAIVATGQGTTLGIALDVQGGRVYWSSTTLLQIRSAPITGGTVSTVLSGLSSAPYGLGILKSSNQLFWVQGSTNAQLRVSSLSGQGSKTLANLVNPRDIEVSDGDFGQGPSPTNTPTPVPSATTTVSETPTAGETPIPTATVTPGGSTVTPTATGSITPVGTPTTPGGGVIPTTAPTALPTAVVTLSQVFGSVMSSGTPVPNVLINGGDLGSALTDSSGVYQFTGATSEVTYQLIPERTGLTFAPGSFNQIARIGAAVPVFEASVSAVPAVGCTTIERSRDLAGIDAAARDLRNLAVQEGARLVRLESRHRNLRSSRSERTALVNAARAEFLSFMNRSDQIPEVFWQCDGVATCTAIDVTAAVAAHRQSFVSIRRSVRQLNRYTRTLSSSEAARAARIEALIARYVSNGQTLLRELPGSTFSCG